MPHTRNTPGQVMVASLIGTTIEFYDFYIFATAAALVIGPVFFPSDDPTLTTLAAFMSFGLAFVARPLGGLLFGHFGDRLGRKTTLVASLLLMGSATVGIGLVPGHAAIGLWAPVILCVLRFAQGLCIGGEWGGAALLATENAAPGRRAWFGMFPQLGPSLGFLLANGVFFCMLVTLDDAAFMAWGWRVPFLVSAVLIGIGLYVRVSLTESPVFAAARSRRPNDGMPVMTLLRRNKRALVQGTLVMIACYAIFYITTVWTLNYAVNGLGLDRGTLIGLLCVAILGMAIATPLSALAADRYGRRPVVAAGLVFTIGVGAALGPLLASGTAAGVFVFFALGLTAMGWIYAPMGALLPELLPTEVRYSGAAIAYSLGGIFGASLAPYGAEALRYAGGASWVGGYVIAMSLVSLASLATIHETRTQTW
ncbi:MFS transporter [uncultured Salinisphaera sp.]|uniref:MFS transporter n=1 Tax=uncultured Salinisphaera sp. TaxID=359372 RepID=UPI0032B179E1